MSVGEAPYGYVSLIGATNPQRAVFIADGYDGSDFSLVTDNNGRYKVQDFAYQNTTNMGVDEYFEQGRPRNLDEREIHDMEHMYYYDVNGNGIIGEDPSYGGDHNNGDGRDPDPAYPDDGGGNQGGGREPDPNYPDDGGGYPDRPNPDDEGSYPDPTYPDGEGGYPDRPNPDDEGGYPDPNYPDDGGHTEDHDHDLQFTVENVLYDGYNQGVGIYELTNGGVAIGQSGAYQGQILDPIDAWVQQLNELENDQGVDLKDAVGLTWYDRPRMYFQDEGQVFFADLRERYGEYQVDANLQALDQKGIYQVEYEIDVDLDGDNEVGDPPAYVQTVLFDGYNFGQGVYELTTGAVVLSQSEYRVGDGLNWWNNIEGFENNLGIELTDLVGLGWAQNGPKMYFADGAQIFRQDFSERDGNLNADGELRDVSDQITDIENELGIDLNGDGEYGEPIPVVYNVLFDGYNTGQGVYELSTGNVVLSQEGWQRGDSLYDGFQTIGEMEENDHGVELNDIVGFRWVDRGIDAYLESEYKIYTQNFRDDRGEFTPSGSLRLIEGEDLYRAEQELDIDLDGDDEIGEPPVFVDYVLFDGYDSNTGQSVFELSNGDIALAQSDYSEGDYLDWYQSIQELENDQGIKLSDVVGMSWGDRGPKLIFSDGNSVFSQDYKDRNGNLETSGGLNTINEDKIYDLENELNVDLDGDDEIGEPPVFVDYVLFD
ncbi:MAG: hypothetical protein AB8B36_14075, partial [Prochlorococcus sp.]